MKHDLLKEWLSPDDLEVVLTIPIAAVHRDDLLIWHHNPSGVYSVKFGYALAKQICHNSNGPSKPSGSPILGTDFWNSIWALDIPLKIRHFWWRVCHNLLAKKLGLFRRKCAASGESPICRKDDESVEHLLFECPWTKAVWFGGSLNMRVNPDSITNVTRWTNDLLQGGNSKTESKRIISSAATIAWFIWKSRNDFVFNHQVVDPHVTLQKITHFWQEHDALIGSFNPYNQASAVPNRPFHLGCLPHQLPWLQSFEIQRATFLTGSAQTCKASSAAQAEAHSVRLACLMAKALNLSRVEIESDNKSEALEHLASIDLIELCNEAKVECCRATRDFRSCGRYVESVLNSCGHASLCTECCQRCDSVAQSVEFQYQRMAILEEKEYGEKQIAEGPTDVTDVCLDESAVSSDPVIAFLLDEVVVKDCSLLKFSVKLSGISNLPEVLDSSFKEQNQMLAVMASYERANMGRSSSGGINVAFVRSRTYILQQQLTPPAHHLHAIFSFLPSLLLSFLQLKYKPLLVSPFETHPTTMLVSITSLIRYCLAYDAKLRFSSADHAMPDYGPAISRAMGLFGSLCLVSLASILCPDSVRVVLYLLYPLFLASQFEFVRRQLQMLWNWLHRRVTSRFQQEMHMRWASINRRLWFITPANAHREGLLPLYQ
ncbi:unnamed protein product [Camellia sinensis]